MKKNKLIVGLVVVVAVVLGSVLFLSQRGAQNQVVPGGPNEMQEVKQMSPDEIGLELELTQNNQVVVITASSIDGIESLEYELSYDAEVEEEGDTVVVPRGAVGELTVSGGTAEAEVDLGTCSANVCKYDTVVSPIKVLIRVNFENGEVGSVESEISIEEE